MRKIILINGPPGSGKDTAGIYLHAKYGFHLEKFAAPIRIAVCGLFGIQDQEIEHLKSEYIMGGRTLRQWMIGFSEEYVKKFGGPYAFGELLVTRIDKSLHDKVVITDSGFQEETDTVVHAFGIENVDLIRIHRDGHDFRNDSRSYVDIPGKDVYDIYNNGSLPSLYMKLENIINNLVYA